MCKSLSFHDWKLRFPARSLDSWLDTALMPQYMQSKWTFRIQEIAMCLPEFSHVIMHLLRQHLFYGQDWRHRDGIFVYGFRIVIQMAILDGIYCCGKFNVNWHSGFAKHQNPEMATKQERKRNCDRSFMDEYMFGKNWVSCVAVCQYLYKPSATGRWVIFTIAPKGWNPIPSQMPTQNRQTIL